MKLTKEQVYINLQGKTIEELTELKNILFEFKQNIFRVHLISYYYENQNDYNYFHFVDSTWLADSDFDLVKEKTEVTIEQIKEILQPMETLEQKLRKEATERGFVNGVKFYGSQGAESTKPMLINDNIKFTNSYNCGLYVNNSWICFNGKWGTLVEETLQEKALRLENELNEVKHQIEEENNIKIGDWVKRTYKGIEIFKADHTHDYRYINSEKRVYKKITNPELIKLLEQEIK